MLSHMNKITTMHAHLCVNRVQLPNTIKTTYRNSTGGEKSISMSRAIHPIVVVRFIYKKKKEAKNKFIPKPETGQLF